MSEERLKAIENRLTIIEKIINLVPHTEEDQQKAKDLKDKTGESIYTALYNVQKNKLKEILNG